MHNIPKSIHFPLDSVYFNQNSDNIMLSKYYDIQIVWHPIIVVYK